MKMPKTKVTKPKKIVNKKKIIKKNYNTRSNRKRNNNFDILLKNKIMDIIIYQGHYIPSERNDDFCEAENGETLMPSYLLEEDHNEIFNVFTIIKILNKKYYNYFNQKNVRNKYITYLTLKDVFSSDSIQYSFYDKLHRQQNDKLKKIHRPSHIIFDKGKVLIEMYHFNDKKSNKSLFKQIDYPSVILYDEKSNVSVKHYFKDGIPHRDEKLGPAKIFYKDKIKIHEVYYNNGNILRKNGKPADIRYYEDTGYVQYELYNDFDNDSDYFGIMNNEKPYEIFYYNNKNKQIFMEKYGVEGITHRNNDKGPAIIEYYEDGTIKKEIYMEENRIHIDLVNKPSVISYYPNGFIKSEKFMIKNFYFRKNKPTKIKYRPNIKGRIMCESYLTPDGKLHRENGPAFISYDINGKIASELFYKNNKLIKNKK